MLRLSLWIQLLRSAQILVIQLLRMITGIGFEVISRIRMRGDREVVGMDIGIKLRDLGWGLIPLTKLDVETLKEALKEWPRLLRLAWREDFTDAWIIGKGVRRSGQTSR